MENENNSAEPNESAEEILNRIMANIPLTTSVDFDTRTITNTYRDGRVETKQISKDNPEYTIELKVNKENKNE